MHWCVGVGRLVDYAFVDTVNNMLLLDVDGCDCLGYSLLLDCLRVGTWLLPTPVLAVPFVAPTNCSLVSLAPRRSRVIAERVWWTVEPGYCVECLHDFATSCKLRMFWCYVSF